MIIWYLLFFLLLLYGQTRLFRILHLKMKNIRIFALLFVLLSGGTEQILAQDDLSPLFVGKIEKQYQQALYKDNPYFFDTYNPFKGDISHNGIVYKNVDMRYDMLNQQIVVSTPVSNRLVVPEQFRIDWFSINGTRYVHSIGDSTCYAAELLDGSINGLLLQRESVKKISGEVAHDGHYQYTLKTSTKYNLRMLDGSVHEVAKAKDIIRLFPDQEEQIKSFVKQNRLSFRSSTRSVSLSRLVASLTTDYIAQKTTTEPLSIDRKSVV